MKKLFSKPNFKKYFYLVGLVLILVFAFSSSERAKSSVGDNVTGYAWGASQYDDGDPSTNPNPRGGVGWISFNCLNDNSCNDSNYGVSVDETTGLITGYAWSSNYGWIRFGGQSVFPSGGGTTAENARLVVDNNSPDFGKVFGWAIACSSAPNPNLCIGNTSSEGWIALRGTGYGVSWDMPSKEFSGYAWGGNEGYDSSESYFGWISFNCSTDNSCGQSDYKVKFEPITSPAVDISADSTSLLPGESTIIRWNGVKLKSGNTCTATGGTSNWNTPPQKSSPSGTFNTGAINTAGTYTFTITCEGDPSGSATDSVQVTVGDIDLIFRATPSVTYPPNYLVDLSWDAFQGSNQVTMTNCFGYGDPLDGSNNPYNQIPVHWPLTNSPYNGPTVPDTTPGTKTSVYIPPSNFPNTTLLLKCTTPGGTVLEKYLHITRGTLNESITLSHTKPKLPPGGLPKEITISWQTVNMQPGSCVASSSPATNWSGPKADNGSEAGIKVYPPPTTYTLTCVGISGNTRSASFVATDADTKGGNTKWVEN